MTVHNHRPWRPMCNERVLPNGSLRGACLPDLSCEPETNDDDSTDQTQGDAA